MNLNPAAGGVDQWNLSVDERFYTLISFAADPLLRLKGINVFSVQLMSIGSLQTLKASNTVNEH